MAKNLSSYLYDKGHIRSKLGPARVNYTYDDDGLASPARLLCSPYSLASMLMLCMGSEFACSSSAERHSFPAAYSGHQVELRLVQALHVTEHTIPPSL